MCVKNLAIVRMAAPVCDTLQHLYLRERLTLLYPYSEFHNYCTTVPAFGNQMVAEGEKVAERLSARGTHEGEFMGVAPIGKRVEWQGQAIFHISEGKVLECRGMPDMLGLLQQIGAVPAPEQPEEASPT